MALKNGGSTGLYTWGQTLEEVTVRLNVEGLRAKELSVTFSRCHLTVTCKATGHKLLAGELQQPIICEDSSWMMDDGEMILQLAKDNKRAANVRDGPSSEWWLGVLEGEDSIDSKEVSVEDYVRPEQLPPEQREKAMREPASIVRPTKSAAQLAAEAEAEASRQHAAATEAELPSEKKEMLSRLRAQFPDIPIEWGGPNSLGYNTNGSAEGGGGSDKLPSDVASLSLT
mmetsp:Transcript_8183/g.16444  ORF Transcript_8183/g.16444 Transcript_8183/m.16444 type:complete len:228 (+) Transcript_8183:79-762(+)